MENDCNDIRTAMIYRVAQNVSHYQMIKKRILNRIKACQ